MFKFLMLVLAIAVALSSIANIPLYIDLMVSVVVATIVMLHTGGKGL